MDKCPRCNGRLRPEQVVGSGLYHPETLYMLITREMMYTGARARQYGQTIGLCDVCKVAYPFTSKHTPREHTYAGLERQS